MHWTERFLETLRCENTRKTYTSDLRALERFFGRINGKETEGDLVKFARDLQRIGLSGSTVRQRLQRVGRFYLFLEERGVCKSNPVRMDVVPKVVDSRAPKAPSTEELRRVAQSLDLKSFLGLQNAVMISLMVYEGLRVCEVANLRRDSLRDIDRQLQLEVTGKGGHLSTVVVWPQTEKIFRKYLGKCVFKSRQSPLFFGATKVDQSLTTRTVRRRVDEVFRRAKLPLGLSCHSLRHWSASNLAAQGVPLSAIQKHLRHKHIETTFVYLQNLPNMPEASQRVLPKKVEFELVPKRRSRIKP